MLFAKNHNTAFEFELKLYTKLENVAINNVLPFKGARRDAIANFKCFWGPGTPAI